MTRASRRRRPSKSRKSPPSFLGLKGTGLYVAGFVVAVIAVAAITAASLTGGSDGDATEGEFPLTVYQGAEELGGFQVDFNSLIGQGRPVILNFWAGACPPCRAEMPAFQRVYDANKDDILLVGVDIGPYVQLGSQQDARNLLTELGITYPAAFSVSRQPVIDYNVQGMPTTVFFNAAGEIVSVTSGFISESELESTVEFLLSLSD